MQRDAAHILEGQDLAAIVAVDEISLQAELAKVIAGKATRRIARVVRDGILDNAIEGPA